METGKRGWRLARWAGAVVLGGAMALTASGVALAADPVTGTAGAGEGIDIAVGTKADQHPATTSALSLTIDGKKHVAYCVDFFSDGVPTTPDAYSETTWSGSAIKGDLGKVQWVLTHGYPSVSAAALLTAAGVKTAPAPALATKIAYAGTQAAIWNFSDNLPLVARDDVTDKSKVASAAVYTAVQQVFDFLVKNASSLPEPAPTLTITPASLTGEVGTRVGPFTVMSSGTDDITLTATGGTLVDKDGKPVTTLKSGGEFFVTGVTAGKATVTATGNGTVPMGRVFVAGKGKQKLILAGAAGKPLTASASATLTPNTPGLPVTGASVTGAIAGGLLLLVGGGLGVVAVRRRRIRFTA